MECHPFQIGMLFAPLHSHFTKYTKNHDITHGARLDLRIQNGGTSRSPASPGEEERGNERGGIGDAQFGEMQDETAQTC